MADVFPGLSAIPNVHPLLVHFPIVLWPLALVFMLTGYLRKDETAFRHGAWVLYAGVASGVAAGITGWLAAEGMGHNHSGHELVHDHRNLMLAALAIAAVASLATFWARKPARGPQRWIPITFLLIACLTSVLGADRGGLLVYGHGVGVATQPPNAEDHPTPQKAGHGSSDHAH